MQARETPTRAVTLDGLALAPLQPHPCTQGKEPITLILASSEVRGTIEFPAQMMNS